MFVWKLLFLGLVLTPGLLVPHLLLGLVGLLCLRGLMGLLGLLAMVGLVGLFGLLWVGSSNLLDDFTPRSGVTPEGRQIGGPMAILRRKNPTTYWFQHPGGRVMLSPRSLLVRILGTPFPRVEN